MLILDGENSCYQIIVLVSRVSRTVYKESSCEEDVKHIQRRMGISESVRSKQRHTEQRAMR